MPLGLPTDDASNVSIIPKPLQGFFQISKTECRETGLPKPNYQEDENKKMTRIHVPTPKQEIRASPDISTLDASKRKELANNFAASGSKEAIVSFLAEKFPAFLTEDVVNNNSFISGFSESSKILSSYVQLKNIYMKQQVKQVSKTEILKLLNSIDEKLASLFREVKEAAKIKLDMAMGTQGLSLACVQKQSHLTQIVAFGCEICHLIRKSVVQRKLKKRLRQQASRQINYESSSEESQNIKLMCWNAETNWTDAYAQLEINTMKTTVISSSELY